MKLKTTASHAIQNPQRRGAMKTAAAGVAAMTFPFVWTPARAASKRIVVRDDGGIYSKAYGAVFYRPFAKLTGIEVIGVQATAEPTAQVRSMVDAGSYIWDMAKLSQAAVLLLTSGDKMYLERHDLESDPTIATIPQQYMSPYAVGTNVYTTLLAYRKDAFKGRKAPQSWADFWNVEEFAGRRSMYKFPYDTIEESLMAAGVPTGKVYPCDLDKAFASLSRIKPHVDVWWTTGAQVEQMLGSGEVDMVATWVSRAQSAMAAGAPVEVVWHQNIWGCDSWAILKGTPNADACREFIKFASHPKQQAKLAEFFPAGFTQPAAFDYVKPGFARNSPSYPANIASGLHESALYWKQNRKIVLDRFNNWILS